MKTKFFVAALMGLLTIGTVFASMTPDTSAKAASCSCTDCSSCCGSSCGTGCGSGCCK